MKEVVLGTWADFAKAVQDVYGAIEPTPPHGIPPQPLFRGHPDAAWGITTTLDRYPGAPKTFGQYWRAINQLRYPLESYTGATWDFSDDEYEKWKRSPLSDTHFMNVPGYELLVHLRHHGLPSPLLDWTRSPWIAAYFAFRDVQRAATHVAILAYLDSVSGGRTFAVGTALVHTLGPFVRTHRRHFLQQCAYTVCARRLDPPEWQFEQHDATLSASKSTRQDLLWKFVLPATERARVLADLENYNIGAYSLFGSEESLMETLAARHFFLGKRI